MNKDRRKTLERLVAEVSNLQGKLADIRMEIESARDEEQEYYDNMPESFQSGEKGDAVQAAVEALEEALSACEEAEGQMGQVEEALGTAQG